MKGASDFVMLWDCGCLIFVPKARQFSTVAYEHGPCLHFTTLAEYAYLCSDDAGRPNPHQSSMGSNANSPYFRDTGYRCLDEAWSTELGQTINGVGN